MPLFNGNQKPPYTAVSPGDNLALFNGTETPTAGIVSTVLCRTQQGSMDAGTTFQVAFGSAPTATVIIYGSNVTPTSSGPSNGIVLATITTQTAGYTDTNRYAFYWAVLTAYTAGGMPQVLAQR